MSENPEETKPAAPKASAGRPAGARPAGARPAGARGGRGGARSAGAKGGRGATKAAGASRPAKDDQASAKTSQTDASADNAEQSKPKAKVTPEDLLQMPPPDISIKKFNPVYLLQVSDSNVICTICKNSLTDVCMYCMKEQQTDPSQCQVQKGQCGHKFHLHCLNQWLNKYQTCPSCGVPWKLASS